MNTEVKKDIQYISGGISGGLILGIILIWCSIFLSSCDVEAHNGYNRRTSPVDYIDPIYRSPHVGGRVAAMVWAPHLSVFERPQAPVRYILFWPHLPSVEETRVKLAKVRLATWMAEEKEIKEARAAAMELRLDWEAFWKAFALCLICSGGALSFLCWMHGPLREKHPERKDRLT